MRTSIALFFVLAGCSEASVDAVVVDAGARTGTDVVTAADTGSPADAGSPADTGAAATGLVFNEIRATGAEFVEVFNGGSLAVDLSNVQMTDTESDGGGPHLSAAIHFPAGTSVAPGQYLVVVSGVADAGAGLQHACLDGGVATCFEAGWSISASRGETVYLLSPTGAVAASEMYPASAASSGQSWGRLPNGTGAFAVNRPTPGAANLAP